MEELAAKITALKAQWQAREADRPRRPDQSGYVVVLYATNVRGLKARVIVHAAAKDLLMREEPKYNR